MRTIYSAIFHNIFIKIIAMFLAILTWSYIVGQLYRAAPDDSRSSPAVVNLSDQNVIVKKLPVYVNLVGKPLKKYMVAVDKIRVNPSECVITGPLESIEALNSVTTKPISVDGLTKSIKRNVKLKELPGCSISEGQNFTVTIPIVRKRLK